MEQPSNVGPECHIPIDDVDIEWAREGIIDEDVDNDEDSENESDQDDWVCGFIIFIFDFYI